MRYLIVNADDFGYSYGINKGIIEAHTKGLVTSTSVMVDAIASAEAQGLHKFKELSVGLHFVVGGANSIEAELSRQVDKFVSIVGRKPDHIDTHKSEPSSIAEVRNLLNKYSQANGTPIRSLGATKLIKSFFGLNIDGSGVLDKSRVTLESLKLAIGEATDEYNELMCHPGYSDDYLRQTSSYNDIRELELSALTDPAIKQYIDDLGDMVLISWDELMRQQRFGSRPLLRIAQGLGATVEQIDNLHIYSVDDPEQLLESAAAKNYLLHGTSRLVTGAFKPQSANDSTKESGSRTAFYMTDIPAISMFKALTGGVDGRGTTNHGAGLVVKDGKRSYVGMHFAVSKPDLIAEEGYVYLFDNTATTEHVNGEYLTYKSVKPIAAVKIKRQQFKYPIDLFAAPHVGVVLRELLK